MSGRFGKMATDSVGMATDPPVSEAQRRAMYAALSGKSTLGIPKKVAEKFVGGARDANTAFSPGDKVKMTDSTGTRSGVIVRLHSDIPNNPKNSKWIVKMDDTKARLAIYQSQLKKA